MAQKIDVLDVLIDVLIEHEKKLDKLIKRLERLTHSESLDRYR